MIVETSFMQMCGKGTPMLSRRGKSTSVQYLVFNEQKDDNESSFAKEKKEQEFFQQPNEEEQLEIIYEQLNNEKVMQNTQNNEKREKKKQKKQEMAIFRSVPRNKTIDSILVKPSNCSFKQCVIDPQKKSTNFQQKEPNLPRQANPMKPFCQQNNQQIQTKIMCKFRECSYYSRKIKKITAQSNPKRLQPLEFEKEDKANPQIIDIQHNNSFSQEDTQKLAQALQSQKSIQRNSVIESPSPTKEQLNNQEQLQRLQEYSLQQPTRDQSPLFTQSRLSYHVPSPILFQKQIDRSPINQGINLNENRFTMYNLMPNILSKYKKVNSFNLAKQSMNTSFFSKNANDSSPSYNPKFEYIQKPLSKGVLNFTNYTKRGYVEELNQSKKIWPSNYDPEKLEKSFNYISKFKRQQQFINFDLTPGRDDKLMYNIQNKKEVIPDQISFQDYLPNSIKRQKIRKTYKSNNKLKLKRKTEL